MLGKTLLFMRPDVLAPATIAVHSCKILFNGQVILLWLVAAVSRSLCLLRQEHLEDLRGLPGSLGKQSNISDRCRTGIVMEAWTTSGSTPRTWGALFWRPAVVACRQHRRLAVKAAPIALSLSAAGRGCCHLQKCFLKDPERGLDDKRCAVHKAT